jgi:hypothetical protein
MNGQILIHKEIYPQLVALGRNYQKLHEDTRALYYSMPEFFANFTKWSSKFHALEVSLTEVKSIHGINQVDFQKRSDTINAISNLATTYLKVVPLCTHDSNEKMREILEFGNIIDDTVIKLKKVKDDLPASKILFNQIQEKYKKQLDNYKIVTGRIQLIKDKLEEQKKLYETLID